MKNRWVISIVSAVFLLVVQHRLCGAVNTRKIEQVRNKQVLDPEADFGIIDEFVGEAIEELVTIRDFSEVGATRTAILTRASCKHEGARAQYEGQFIESARKHLASAFQKASGFEDPDRRFKAMANLLILVSRLENPRLMEMGLAMLRDDNAVVRYLAVHSVTNPAVLRKIDTKTARRIAAELKALVGSSSPETIGLIAKFAGGAGIPEGEELLMQIVDMRIRRYADWTVEYELLDGQILYLVSNKISSEASNKCPLVQRFGQLYSYAMQRYIEDAGGGDFLSDASRQQIVSVMIEIEKACIGRLTGRPQSTIKRAVERKDVESLVLEHDRLLGGEAAAGVLGQKYGCPYVDQYGRERMGPLALPERPKRVGASG